MNSYVKLDYVLFMKSKVRIFIITIFVGIFLIFSVDNVYSQSVPDWVKNTAGWWAMDQISETEFLNAIEFLIKESIIQIPSTTQTQSSDSVPDWVKNTAGWWATDAISDTEFVNAIDFLVNEGIISLDNESSLKDEIERFFEESVIHIEENAHINSHGFRGVETTKDKPIDTFRMLTVGGSTTFSIGVTDEYTWPAQLQTKLNSLDTKLDIEVINAGISAATSFSNVKLIKERLVQFEPDLIIIYEGVNDQGCLMPPFHNQFTKSTVEEITRVCGIFALEEYPSFLAERYSDICGFAHNNDFEVIVAFQPTVKLDGKLLTDQEINSYFDRPQYPVLLEDYEKIVNVGINDINGCYSVVDLRGIFDQYDIPLYEDYHHVGNIGNSIIAENILEQVLPILIERNILDDNSNYLDKLEAKKIHLAENHRNSDFSNQNIQNESFFGADLKDSSFLNSKLTNVDFRLVNLEYVDFSNSEINNIKLRQNSLKGADFTNVDFTNVDLTNVDLSYTNLQNTNLSNKDLEHTFFHKTDLTGADMSNTNLINSFFHGTKLSNTILDNARLENVNLTEIDNKSLVGASVLGTGFSYSDFRGVDVSGLDFSWVNMKNANLSGLDLTDNEFHGTVFVNADLSYTNLSGLDLSPKGKIYTELFADKSYLIDQPIQVIKQEIWSNSKPSQEIYSTDVSTDGNDLIVKFFLFTAAKEANLTGANLQNANLQTVLFYDADLTNADLTNADLTNADLTNADLTGADLTDAILTGANLNCSNHDVCINN